MTGVQTCALPIFDDVLGELGELLVGHEHVFLALADLHIHQLLILDGENDLVRVMQTGDKHGVVAILGLSPRRSRFAARRGLEFRAAAEHRIDGGAAGADGLVQVCAVLIQVADQAAQLARGIQALDGLVDRKSVV